MKLLHVVQAYYPALGGVEGLARNVSERLVTTYGDQVNIYTTASATTEALWRGPARRLPEGVEMIDGVAVRRFRVFTGLQWPRGLLARGSRRLRLPGNDWLRTLETGPIVPAWPGALAAADADVIFATSFPWLHMYYAGAAARRCDKPLVLLGAIHTDDPWGYDRQNMLRLIRQADAYIALTTHERDYLVAREVDAARIHLIGGGVDAERFAQADGATVRQAHGWGDDPVIGVVARQSSLKRIDIAIDSMPRVWAKHPRARLMLAGAATSHTPALLARIQAMPPAQQERITMIHNFAEAEKPALLAACDILVHPSINESFAIALVEGWAAGKPVIGGDRGAIPAVIDLGHDGLLFHYPDPASLAQALIVLLDDPAHAAQLGAAGRAKVAARYTWPRVTAQLRSIYETVTHQPRTRTIGERQSSSIPNRPSDQGGARV